MRLRFGEHIGGKCMTARQMSQRLLSCALRRKKLGLTRAREQREYAEENASAIEVMLDSR